LASRSNVREKWLSVLDRFSKSDKNASQWCKEEGVSYQSFIGWKNRFKNEKDSLFIELQDESLEQLELKFRNLRIIFSQIEDLKKLAHLLRGLC